MYHQFKNENELYLAVMKAAVQRSSVLLDSLEEHLISGTLLTALIGLLFLKNLCSIIIIAVAIPVSL